MEVFSQVLVSIALVALGVAVYFQGKTIVSLREWIDLLERRLDRVQTHSECVDSKANGLVTDICKLDAKVSRLEKEVRR